MTPEEVQKEWHQIALAKCIQPQEYHKGRNDFKSALREEIEKQRKEMRYEYAVRLYDSFLETIDSITPKK